MIRRIAWVALGCLLLSCGEEGGGVAPTISDLNVPSTITRGTQANGSMMVSDPDGLGGLKLDIKLTGPADIQTQTPVQGTSDNITAAEVGVILLVPGGQAAGTYTLTIAAIDGANNRSNELSADVDVQ